MKFLGAVVILASSLSLVASMAAPAPTRIAVRRPAQASVNAAANNGEKVRTIPLYMVFIDGPVLIWSIGSGRCPGG